jgi:hypothetical protein
LDDTVSQPGSGVEADAEALAGGVGAGKVGVGPLAVFAHQLDVAVARFGHFGQPLLKGQAVEDSPEHDRKAKRGRGGLSRPVDPAGAAAPGFSLHPGQRCGERGRGQGLRKAASIHAGLPDFFLEDFVGDAGFDPIFRDRRNSCQSFSVWSAYSEPNLASASAKPSPEPR